MASVGKSQYAKAKTKANNIKATCLVLLRASSFVTTLSSTFFSLIIFLGGVSKDCTAFLLSKLLALSGNSGYILLKGLVVNHFG